MYPWFLTPYITQGVRKFLKQQNISHVFRNEICCDTPADGHYCKQTSAVLLCVEKRTCLLLSWVWKLFKISLALHRWKSAWNGKLLDYFTSFEEGVLISMVLEVAWKYLKHECILLLKYMVETKFTEMDQIIQLVFASKILPMGYLGC